MNRLIESRINAKELLAHLLDAEMTQEKAESRVEQVFNMSGTVYVGYNEKHVSLRADGFIGIASCNRYARHINRPAVPMRHGVTLNAVKKDQKPDDFNLSRGVAIAAKRLITIPEINEED